MVDDDGFTATDALALDVEQVEQFAREVVNDGDAPTPLLVSLVTRLRTTADLLADYLFRTSEPTRRATEADADARLCRTPRRPRRARDGDAVKQGPGRDSGGRPQGVPSGPERSVPESPASTIQGQSSTDCTA